MRTFTVTIGVAIQDGNYIGKKGTDSDYNKENYLEEEVRKNIVPKLHAFAKDFQKWIICFAQIKNHIFLTMCCLALPFKSLLFE